MESTNYCIYMHILTLDNRKYVGITRLKPSVRWAKGNGYSNNQYFYNTIKKYGWDNFRHEILFEGLTREQACAKERALIKLFNTTDSKFGFNLSPGGEGNTGYHHSKSVKEKIKKKRAEQVYAPMPIDLINKINAVDTENINVLHRQTVGHSDRDTTNYTKEQARRRELGLSSLYTSGKNNGMYGKGYLISGGNNGHANVRYFFKDQVFESRKELLEYLHSHGYNITSSAIRRVIRGIGTRIVYDKYREVFDNLSWELKYEDKKC